MSNYLRVGKVAFEGPSDKPLLVFSDSTKWKVSEPIDGAFHDELVSLKILGVKGHSVSIDGEGMQSKDVAVLGDDLEVYKLFDAISKYRDDLCSTNLDMSIDSDSMRCLRIMSVLVRVLDSLIAYSSDEAIDGGKAEMVVLTTEG